MLGLLKKIPTSKATGCDGLSAKVLKLVAPVLASPFCGYLNLSIRTGSFPSTRKTAEVTSLFNNGSHEDAGNYRPISVLPVFSWCL